jgi:hypothetical protein
MTEKPYASTKPMGRYLVENREVSAQCIKSLLSNVQREIEEESL